MQTVPDLLRAAADLVRWPAKIGAYGTDAACAGGAVCGENCIRRDAPWSEMCAATEFVFFD